MLPAKVNKICGFYLIFSLLWQNTFTTLLFVVYIVDVTLSAGNSDCWRQCRLCDRSYYVTWVFMLREFLCYGSFYVTGVFMLTGFLCYRSYYVTGVFMLKGFLCDMGFYVTGVFM